MKDVIISQKTAIQAMAKGFNELCPKAYLYSGGVHTLDYWEKDREEEGENDEGDTQYGFVRNDRIVDEADLMASAPTQSLLQAWLRKTHNIYVMVHLDETMEPKFCNSVKQVPDKYNYIYLSPGMSDLFLTYEEALEDGLFVALHAL